MEGERVWNSKVDFFFVFPQEPFDAADTVLTPDSVKVSVHCPS